MAKISRYILVLIGIMAASIALPELYWIIFRQSRPTPNIVYSRILDDFLMVTREDGEIVRIDTRGNYYTRDAFEENLPLLFFRQLLITGNMPDSIKGVPMDHAELSKHAAYFNFRPIDLNTPRPVLWPLLESRSGRVNLEIPEDYFRIHRRIEFIVAETNRVDREKSDRFNEALLGTGFVFPAQFVAGLPTTRKNVDEGYFIKDSQGDLFHLKMVRGNPFVAHIPIPEELDIVHIECVDLRTEEFYAYLFTACNRIYLLMQGGYALQHLPIEGYDRYAHRLRVRKDILHKTVSIMADDHIRVTVIDDDYDIVDYYEEYWEKAHERPDHVMFARIFPFQLQMIRADSRFVTFSLEFSKGVAFLALHVLLTALSVYLLRRKGRDLRKHGPDLLLVLLTGLFGFIATRVFPNKFYD